MALLLQVSDRSGQLALIAVLSDGHKLVLFFTSLTLLPMLHCATTWCVACIVWQLHADYVHGLHPICCSSAMDGSIGSGLGLCLTTSYSCTMQYCALTICFAGRIRQHQRLYSKTRQHPPHPVQLFTSISFIKCNIFEAKHFPP